MFAGHVDTCLLVISTDLVGNINTHLLVKSKNYGRTKLTTTKSYRLKFSVTGRLCWEQGRLAVAMVACLVMGNQMVISTHVCWSFQQIWVVTYQQLWVVISTHVCWSCRHMFAGNINRFGW